jgi:hypothetical protein
MPTIFDFPIAVLALGALYFDSFPALLSNAAEFSGLCAMYLHAVLIAHSLAMYPSPPLRDAHGKSKLECTLAIIAN